MAEIGNIPRNWLLGPAEIAKKVKDLAYALTGAESGPVQFSGDVINQLIGKAPEVLENASYGFPPTKGTGFATQVSPDVLDVANLLPTPGPGMLAKVIEGVSAKLGAGAALGMLRPGGRKDLMMSHGTDWSSITGKTGDPDRLLKDITSPSIAVTGDSKIGNAFDSGVLLIPRSGAFDPAYSNSTLWNRDAYTPRYNQYPNINTPEGRNRARFELQAVAHGEGAGNNWWQKGWDPDKGGSHAVAIDSSPHFRSFEEFEKSSKGANLLGADYNDISNWSDNWAGKLGLWWAKTQGDRPYPSGYSPLPYLQEAAKAGDKEALSLMKMAQHAPSEYGELKVNGPVPLTGQNWAGALLRQERFMNPGDVQSLAEAMARRGIESTVYKDFLPGKDLFKLAEEMQQYAGPVRTTRAKDLNTTIYPSGAADFKAGWGPGKAEVAAAERPASVPEATFESIPEGLLKKPAMKAEPMLKDSIHNDPSALATAKITLNQLKPGETKFFKNVEGETFSVNTAGDVEKITPNGWLQQGNIWKSPSENPLMPAAKGVGVTLLGSKWPINDEWSNKLAAAYNPEKKVVVEHNGTKYHVGADGTIWQQNGMNMKHVGQLDVGEWYKQQEKHSSEADRINDIMSGWDVPR